MSARLNRRQLLAAAGLGASSLFLPSLGRAQSTAAPPKRLVVFYTLHGTVYDRWKMRREGLGEDADWELPLADVAAEEMSEILRPLHPVRDEVLVLDGLALATGLGDVIFNDHEKGQAHSLTGSPIIQLSTTRASASSASVDQIIARAIRRSDRIASLELGTGGGNSVIYGGANVRVPFENEPQAVFDRIFAGVAPTGNGDRDKVARAQPSVLDFVRGEYERTAPRLGSEDRRKLELHRDLVRDLEQRLSALASASCTPPARPPFIRPVGTTWYQQRTAAFTQMIAAVLACDLTRVVSLQMAQLPNDVIGAPPGDVHADFAHHDLESTTAADVMTAYHRKHAEQLRALIEALDAVPEGNGTLLDSTVVLWVNELATGNHRMNRWPAVIAGGGFRTGRYLRWAPRTPTPHPNPTWSGVEPMIGAPHNKLLVSVARQLGVPLDAVGLRSIRTKAGVDVDLTGGLDRLT